MRVQISRSPRLLNGFWCFLVQNEGEVLLVSFLVFSETVWELKLLKCEELVEKVSKCRGYLLTSPMFQYLFRVGMATKIMEICNIMSGNFVGFKKHYLAFAHPNMSFQLSKEKICGYFKFHMLDSLCGTGSPGTGTTGLSSYFCVLCWTFFFFPFRNERVVYSLQHNNPERK